MTQPCKTSIKTPPGGDALLAGLRGDGQRHDEAIRELLAMLLRAARFEVGRRSTALAHVRGEDREDLALQAADDAFVAVMLHDARGTLRSHLAAAHLRGCPACADDHDSLLALIREPQPRPEPGATR